MVVLKITELIDNQSEKKKKKYQIKMMQYPDENLANLITNSGRNQRKRKKKSEPARI